MAASVSRVGSRWTAGTGFVSSFFSPYFTISEVRMYYIYTKKETTREKLKNIFQSFDQKNV